MEVRPLEYFEKDKEKFINSVSFTFFLGFGIGLIIILVLSLLAFKFEVMGTILSVLSLIIAFIGVLLHGFVGMSLRQKAIEIVELQRTMGIIEEGE